jgi:hypothetical protein
MFGTGFIPSLEGSEKDRRVTESGGLRRRDLQRFRELLAVIQAHISHEHIPPSTTSEWLAIISILREHAHQLPAERDLTIRPVST